MGKSFNEKGVAKAIHSLRLKMKATKKKMTDGIGLALSSSALAKQCYDLKGFS